MLKTKKSGHLAARSAQEFRQDPQAVPPQVAQLFTMGSPHWLIEPGDQD
jgi:hypothetical protein